MKFVTTILLLGSLLLAGFEPKQNKPSENVAVVELFTSEGCSSCPAADEVLKEMTGIMKKEGKQVIGLAFHITYWNRLGWIDPYSQEEFTTRQKRYTEILNVETGVYTPQAVVNGQYQFVGSNPISFRNFVEQVHTQNPAYSLNGEAQFEHGFVKVNYTINKKPRNEVINIALVEKHIERKILRGENKSRTLQHFNVVRKFESHELLRQGSITLTLPDDLAQENASVVLYIQHRKSMKILGGTLIN
jgi:hypothetical protein